jgi:hypothetical protein
MTRRPNRVILLVVALVLIAAAVLALLAAAGIVNLLTPADLYQRARASAALYPLAWQAGFAVAGLFLIVLGAWLVRRQLRLRPGGRLDTVTLQRGDRGRTTVAPAQVAGAAAADLRHVRGVAGSNVRLVTFGARPRLIVDLDVDREAPLREVLDRTESVYARLSQSLGVEGVHVDTTVRPTGREQDRVQ